MIQATAHFRDMADWSGTSPEELVATHLERKANTARGYRQDLDAFAKWCGAADRVAAVASLIDAGRAACKRRLLAYINAMDKEHLAAKTIRRRVAAITSLVSLASDPDIEIIGWQVGRLKTLPPDVRVRNCTGPDQATVERMFEACRDRWDEKGARDEAILALLYWHAMRATEVLSIQMGDVNLAEKTVRIVAKRGSGRMTMHLCQMAVAAVAKWIDKRGDDDGPLFARCKRWGKRVTSKPLSYWGLRGVIRDLGDAAGRRCWPHALRHAAVSHLAALTDDSPLWGCALSRHRDVRAWSMYQDRTISHVSAAEILSRGQIVRHEPQGADN